MLRMLVSAYYVFFVGVLLPALCVRSYFRLKTGAPFPGKPRIFLQTLVMHALLFALAFFTWRAFDLPLLPPYAVAVKDLALGLVTLVVFVGCMYPLWKRKVAAKDERTYRIMPKSAGELRWWAAVSLSAGFVEEIVYRGVLFGILIYWLKNWWAAAILCALVFAVSHSIQGWKSAVIIFFISLAFQGMVYVNGTLYVAMAVHAIYDFIAGVAYMRLWKQVGPGSLPVQQPAPA